MRTLKRAVATATLTVAATVGMLASTAGTANAADLVATAVNGYGEIVGIYSDGTFVVCDSSGCG